MARAYPCLRIDSYNDAMPYYLDFLGFKVEFEYRHDEASPVYMGISRGESCGISRGELALHLTEHTEQPSRIGVMFDVESVHDLYTELKSKNPSMSEELVDKPWGKTELHLRDPFGNLLNFTSPAPK